MALAVPQPWTSVDAVALVAPLLIRLSLYSPSRSLAFSFGRFYGRRGLAYCQTSASMVPASRRSRLQPTTRSLWLQCVSAVSLQPSASTAKPVRKLRLRRTKRPSWPFCLSDFVLYDPSCTTAFGVCRPHSPRGLRYSATFGFVRPQGSRGLTTCQPPASTSFIVAFGLG